MARLGPSQLLLLLLAYLTAHVTAIDRCPKEEKTYISEKGFIYTICPDSDYKGTTTERIKGIDFASDCADLCDARGDCYKAVYEAAAPGYCHIKTDTGSLSWIVATRYDAIRLTNNLAEGTQVDYCPFNERRYVIAGVTFDVCFGTDFKGTTTKRITNVGSANACASICSSTSGCDRAVFENTENTCHLKTKLATGVKPTYTLNKKYDTIRIVSKA